MLYVHAPGLYVQAQRSPQRAKGHMSPVSCVEVRFAATWLYIITGSLDHTVALWRTQRAEGGPVSLPAAPYATLFVHADAVVRVVASPALDAVVSAGLDRSLVLSSLRKATRTSITRPRAVFFSISYPCGVFGLALILMHRLNL